MTMTNDIAVEMPAPLHLRTDLAVGRPPRAASFRRRVRIGFLATAVLLAVAAVAVVRVAEDVARGIERLRDHGTTTEALVEGKWRSAGKSKTNHLGFSFLHEGRRIEGQGSASSNFWGRVEVGRSVTITFDPDDPTHTALGRVSQATLDRHWERVLWFGGTVGLVLVGIYIGVFCRHCRRRTLLAEGELAQARIDRIGAPRRKSRKCKVAFAVAVGARTVAGSSWIPERLLHGLQAGDSIPLLVAPGDPSRCEPLAIVLSSCCLA